MLWKPQKTLLALFLLLATGPMTFGLDTDTDRSSSPYILPIKPSTIAVNQHRECWKVKEMIILKVPIFGDNHPSVGLASTDTPPYQYPKKA